MTRIVHNLVHDVIHNDVGHGRRTNRLPQRHEPASPVGQDRLCDAPPRSKARPCSLSDELPGPPSGVKGRLLAERGA